MTNLYRILRLLMCAVFAIGLSPAKAQDLQSDSLALVDLYNDCGGANWSGYGTWLAGPLGNWEGVTIDSGIMRVSHVSFKTMELTGTLPASLGNMDEMSGKIEFHDDAGLTGTLPAFLWNWTKVDRFQLKRSGYTSIDTTGLSGMVNLTEFNTEKNAIPGMVPRAIFTLPAMEKIYIHDCEYDQLPAEFTSASGLTRLYLNGNNLTDLPDMSAMVWGGGAKVRFQNNGLTFEDLEMNMPLASDPNVAEFNYSPQGMWGGNTPSYHAAGDAFAIDPNVGGTANIYTWIKNDTGVVGTMNPFTFNSFDPATESGTYHALVQNTIVTGLEITTYPFLVFESATSQDSLALVDLYNNCGGTSWAGFPTWLNGPLNTWEGVTVDSASQRVTHVGFKNMDLSGTLPNSLGNITQMGGKIEIHDDIMLTGELPAALWNWVNVERFQLKRTGITSVNTTGMENMVNLTEYNTEKNAISGMVPGVIFTLPAMEKIYIHDCEYDALPAEFTSASGLTRLYLNGNNLTDLPDMSGMTWGGGAKVRFQNNGLTFEDLEMNMVLAADTNVAEFNYSPQAMVGMENYMYPASGDPVSIAANVGGTTNMYQWIKDEVDPVGTDATYDIAAFDANTNSGSYFASVQNSTVTGLEILTAKTYLYSSPLNQDSLALVDLYNNCGGTSWSGFPTWLNGPLNTWEGVTVDSASQRVTHVAFKNMDLSGTLPSTLGNITQMGGKIEMHDDSMLTGELPSFLWRWVNVDRFQLKRTGITSVNTDGMENMINLTEYNTEANPISGMVPGVIFTLPVMEKIYIHDCEYDQMPPEFTSISGLTRLYLNGNNLMDIPDMSGMTWGDGAKVRFQDNHLTFEDLEANVALLNDTMVAEFAYSPQANVGMADSMYLNTGDTLMLSMTVGGTANAYTWIQDTTAVGGDMLYQVDSVTVSNSGRYKLLVQNSIVLGLDIYSEVQTVYVDGIIDNIEDLQYFGDIKVLGNPVSSNLRIETSKIIEDVMIYSITGQQLKAETVKNTSIDLPVQDLAPGVYIVILRSGNYMHNLKVVKQ